jgi:hypothetical protein
VHGTGKQKQRPALSSNTSNVVKRPSNTTVIAVATAQSLSKPVDAVKVNTHHTVNAAGKEQSAAAMKKQQLVELQADYLRTVYSLHRSRQSLAELRKTTEVCYGWILFKQLP